MPPLNKNCPSKRCLAKCVPVHIKNKKPIKIIWLAVFVNLDQKESGRKNGKSCVAFRQKIAVSQKFGGVNDY